MTLVLALEPLLPAPAGAEDPMVDRGSAVYAAQRCSRCHSIGGEGNRRSPLDGVGARLEDDALRKWVVAPQQMDPRVRKKPYDKLSPEDLDALVVYLKSLKALAPRR